MSALSTSDELGRLESLIDDTLRAAHGEIDMVGDVQRGEIEQPFWYVRLDGDAKDHYSAEFTLGQRTLVCESYFMPAPEENHAQLFEHLLTRNRSMYPLNFTTGAEDAIYLRAQVENRHVDADLVDRLLASVYDYTEQYFVAAMRLGYQSRFNR